MSKKQAQIKAAWDNAKALFKEGSWKECERAYAEALELACPENGKIDCRHVLLILDYAELLILKERYQDSQKLLNEAIELLEAEPQVDGDLMLQTCLSYVETLSMADLFEDAEPYIEMALQLSDNEEGRANGNYARALALRSASYLSQERFDEAAPLVEEALQLCTTFGINCGEAVSTTWLLKAIHSHLCGDLDGAAQAFLNALAAIKDDVFSRSFQDICYGYATLMISQSRFPEAIEFLMENISQRETLLCSDHPLLKRAISAFALTNSAFGDLDETEVQAQRYYRLVEAMGDPGSELRIEALRVLIDVLVAQSRFSEAEVLLNRASDILERADSDYVKANLISDLARLKLALGFYEEAEDLYTRALTLTRKTKGDDHLETAMCLSLLGSAYFANRKIHEAEQAYRDSIALIEKRHHYLSGFLGGEIYRNLGIILVKEQKFDEAEELFLKILASGAQNSGSEKVLMAETHRNLGELYEAQDKHDDALAQYELAYKLARKIYGDESVEVVDYMCLPASVHRKKSRFLESETLYKEAARQLEGLLGPQHPKTCGVVQRLGELAIETKQYGKAEQYFKTALIHLEQTLGTTHPEIGSTCYCLAASYHWQNKLKQAEEYYKRALEIKEKHLGLHHPDLIAIIAMLIRVLQEQRRDSEVFAWQRRLNELSSYDAARQSH